MRFLGFILATLLLSSSIGHAETCYMEVDDQIIIEGQCTFIPTGGGSFRILDNPDAPLYFAYVIVDRGTAIGYWNEVAGASHAHSDLGALVRFGGCWINDTVRVCAWK